MRPNVPDAMVRGGTTYRILSDWRGSVRAVVDVNAGTVVETIDYDAWGNATVSDTTCASGAVCALFQPFAFGGGLFDRETGLTRFGARDYDAGVGRWTRKDGAGSAGGRNFYAYAWNDPVDYVDVTGAVPQWATDGAQAVIDYAAQVTSGGALGYVLNEYVGASPNSVAGQLGTGTVLAVAAYGAGNPAPIVASLESVAGGTGLLAVTSWASSGTNPDLCPGRWVMLGGPTRWNYLWTGLGGPKVYFSPFGIQASNVPFSNSVTGQLPASSLNWPSGWEAVKGLLGQRVIGGP
jgi:RHS repeat-associated protein